MRAEGVGVGDRVAAMLPNMPEAIAVMLAAASLGAIFSSCSPDFGERGVLDRFGQIEPKLFFAVDGYWYNGKPIDNAEKVKAVAGQADERGANNRRPDYIGRAAEVAAGSFERRVARRVHRGFSPAPAHLRAAAVRSSALHSLLVGHDRRAEMHRAWRRRHAAAASERAPAALLAERRTTSCSISPRSAG